MTATDNYSKNLRRVVLAVGTLLALLFLLGFGPKLYGEIAGDAPSPNRDRSPGQEWEGQVMIATFIIFMLGYIIGWWSRLWGGLVMMSAALVVTVPFIVREGNKGSLIFGIPVLIAGSLYLLLYMDEKRAAIKPPAAP